jgi:hypothetical protein
MTTTEIMFASPDATVPTSLKAIIKMESEHLVKRATDALIEYGDNGIDDIGTYARYGYFADGDGWQWEKWRGEVARKYGMSYEEAEEVLEHAVELARAAFGR